LQITTPFTVVSARPSVHCTGHVALVADTVHGAYDPSSGAGFVHDLHPTLPLLAV
jgi:hypothetical protein